MLPFQMVLRHLMNISLGILQSPDQSMQTLEKQKRMVAAREIGVVQVMRCKIMNIILPMFGVTQTVVVKDWPISRLSLRP
ncbi:hypothetical protein VTN96DRAFT_4480 [Rasamsonia emersonii]